MIQIKIFPANMDEETEINKFCIGKKIDSISINNNQIIVTYETDKPLPEKRD